MTTENAFARDPALLEALGNITIDPATWVEPKETFPGKVTESTYRLASEEYKAATEFRPAITDALPQWSVRVERLDLIARRPDGSQSPWVYYGGIDLKRWSNREKRIVPVNSRFPKEWFTISAWKAIFGTIHPPEQLVGKFAMFDWYETKSFGSVLAKRVLVPSLLLPPDYLYPEEPRIVDIRREEETEEQPEVSTNGPTPVGVTQDQALEILATTYLPGRNANDRGGLISQLPAELQGNPVVIGGLADGTLVKKFQEQGRITVDETGVIIGV